MKIISLLTFIICLFNVTKTSAQNKEEEEVKKVVLLETESYSKRDTKIWENLFVHDAHTNRIYIMNGYFETGFGWEKFGPPYIKWMAENKSQPSKYKTIEQLNFILRVSGEVAAVEYDQKRIADGSDTLPDLYTRELRTLVKTNNQWKISSITTIDTTSYKTTNPFVMESLFNATGYTFLNDNKVEQAVEIFKLNVKLYPKAWNTYDSLGEAYALAGDKKMAIENYEKSIRLNLKNDNGVKILKKLKEN